MWLADLFSARRGDRFAQLLERHARVLVQAAEVFDAYVNGGCPPALADQLRQLELEGDKLVEQVTSSLRDTFVTPMDRQDIYNLCEAIDDTLDYLNNAGAEISIFKVEPTPAMREISRALLEAAREIHTGVANLLCDEQKAWECAHRAQEAENTVEDRYRQTLAELFECKDLGYILKLREVYRHLSNSADRAAAVGRLIGKIVVKAT